MDLHARAWYDPETLTDELVDDVLSDATQKLNFQVVWAADASIQMLTTVIGDLVADRERNSTSNQQGSAERERAQWASEQIARATQLRAQAQHQRDRSMAGQTQTTEQLHGLGRIIASLPEAAEDERLTHEQMDVLLAAPQLLLMLRPTSVVAGELAHDPDERRVLLDTIVTDAVTAAHYGQDPGAPTITTVLRRIARRENVPEDRVLPHLERWLELLTLERAGERAWKLDQELLDTAQPHIETVDEIVGAEMAAWKQIRRDHAAGDISPSLGANRAENLLLWLHGTSMLLADHRATRLVFAAATGTIRTWIDQAASFDRPDLLTAEAEASTGIFRRLQAWFRS